MAKRGTRPGLTREAILATALAIGDDDGVDAISLRRVAHQLGVTAMALYRHLESKEALLDGLLDLAYGEIDLPDPDTVDWWEGLAGIAQSMRRVMLAHPAAAAIAAARPSRGPNTLRIVECILGLLRRAGFDTAAAVEIQTTFTRFVVAVVALEASLMPEPTPEKRQETARRVRSELESLPPDEFPNLIAAGPYIAPYEPGRTFIQALELLKAGIQFQRPLRHRDR